MICICVGLCGHIHMLMRRCASSKLPSSIAHGVSACIPVLPAHDRPRLRTLMGSLGSAACRRKVSNERVHDASA